MVPFACMPIALLLIHKRFKKESVLSALLLIEINILMSFYEFRAWYISVLVQSYVVCFLTISTMRLSRATIKTLVKNILFIIVIPLLANTFWILPFAMNHIITSNVYFQRGLFGDSFLKIQNSLTLYHPFWTGTKPSIFEVQPIPFYMWSIPILAILGVYLNRKNLAFLMYGGLALIGIFLTKQSDIPFPHAYQWLYGNLPGFNTFREASKFFSIIALSYSVLIAALFAKLIQNAHSFNNKIKLAIVSVWILCLIGTLLTPLISESIDTLHLGRIIPGDYINYKADVKESNSIDRSLWVPKTSRWTYTSPEHMAINYTDLLPDTFIDPKKNQMDFITSKSFESVLSDTAITHIIVPLEDIANNDNFFTDYDSRDSIISRLNSLNYLEKIHTSYSHLVVYKFLHPSDIIEARTSNGDKIAITYSILHPYEYKIDIPLQDNSIEITARTTYNPDWHIYTAGNHERPLEERHNESPNHVQKFYINKGDLRTTATDGIAHLSLYLALQKYVVYGLIITLFTVTIVTLLLAVSILTFINEKYHR